MDHTRRTIRTYDKIAGDYHVIATPEVRAWLEDSMREFFARLPGPHPSVLVAGCGEGRDSRYLGGLGARVVSFDLSEGMLSLARAADPGGTYLHVDLREVHRINFHFDGIWACACLYHLTKTEFRACLRTFHQMLNPGGVLFLNLKLGVGEQFIDQIRPGYPGGAAARKALGGTRFYAFYQRDELTDYFADFVVEKERRDLLKEGEGAMEFWLRKSGADVPGSYFTAQEIGERYARYRPKVHDVALSWMEKHLPGQRFSRGIDIACGTGDSMAPLLKLCDFVLGLDSSEEMLAAASCRGLRVVKGAYTDIARHGRFDLLSTCMAFHWFDGAEAIAAYKAASNPGAIWLIYNFAFAGHATSTEFNDWFFKFYLKEFPSPHRNRASDVKPADDSDLHLVAKEAGWLPLTFSPATLIGYLTTQSNIEHALRGGAKLEDLTAPMAARLGQMDLSGTFKYAFTYEIYRYANSQ